MSNFLRPLDGHGQPQQAQAQGAPRPQLVPQLDYYTRDPRVIPAARITEYPIYFDLDSSPVPGVGIPMTYLRNPRFITGTHVDERADPRLRGRMRYADLPVNIPKTSRGEVPKNIFLHIVWPSYPDEPYLHMIPLQENGKLITYFQLAVSVANGFYDFVELCKKRCRTPMPGTRQWKIGSGPGEIDFDRLWLLSLYSVKENFYQADVACPRIEIPRFP